MKDTHSKVQEAGAEALASLASVIRNPEIQACSKELLTAIQKPQSHTDIALKRLLDTTFEHVVDAHST
eukprot:GABW01001534.1.p1 GENE.GABW01001534.1~~GABW01001534.1.p1  ORF type:complete len:68 (-),score=13.27 GABW01001534.1:3-206(-)